MCHAHRVDLYYRREPATFVHYKPDTSVGLVFLFHTKRNFLNSGRTSSSPCSNTCANRLFKVAMNSDGSLRCWCAAAHASCGRVRRAKHLREAIGDDTNNFSQNFRREKMSVQSHPQTPEALGVPPEPRSKPPRDRKAIRKSARRTHLPCGPLQTALAVRSRHPHLRYASCSQVDMMPRR